MMINPVTLLDAAGTVIARAEVSEEAGRFAGLIDLRPMPAALREVFSEYEQIVNGQMFALLDPIEERIAALRLRVIFPGGQAEAVEGLQIYPAEQRISFRVAEETERQMC